MVCLMRETRVRRAEQRTYGGGCALTTRLETELEELSGRHRELSLRFRQQDKELVRLRAREGTRSDARTIGTQTSLPLSVSKAQAVQVNFWPATVPVTCRPRFRSLALRRFARYLQPVVLTGCLRFYLRLQMVVDPMLFCWLQSDHWLRPSWLPFGGEFLREVSWPPLNQVARSLRLRPATSG